MAYLHAFPPKSRQFRSPRRSPLSGVVVVHTAESNTDLILPDEGAEGVASFIARRSDPGSYHAIVDSDSTVELVDVGDEAFHVGTDRTNRHSVGVSFACRAHQWAELPEAWVEGAVDQAARYIAAVAKEHFGARWWPRLITRDDAVARVHGLTSHALLDPNRRSDPGADFPWARLINRIEIHLADNPMEDDAMSYLIHFINESYEAAGRKKADPEGKGFWFDEALKERPGALWTHADCLASPILGTMVALLLEGGQ